MGKFLVKVLNSKSKEKKVTKETLKEYIKSLDEYDLLDLEEKAIELFVQETNTDINFILDMKIKSRESYDNILTKYYLNVINKN